MIDDKEIDALLARAQQLGLRKFGVDISIDPKVEKAAEELAEAACERTKVYNWPSNEVGSERYPIHVPLLQVAAERIAALETELANLKGK